MNETQRRIKAYKEALPGLRERVVAVALLLAMSAAMMTSASFAWLTISRRPEVSGVSTTVAANGNLEIALVGEEGKKPDESKVGDSSATKGQSITASNITWGNLVNLSDPAYGLENLTLRPAQLNTASLLESPLYGAVYGLDGRITQLSSNFGYATWNMPDGDKHGYFGVSDSYGVRAISSTTIEAVGAEAMYYNMIQTAKNKNLGAANMYVDLSYNDAYMKSLGTMMGLYMTARMNSSNPDVSENVEDIKNLRDMYAAFLECFDAEAEAMAALVNLQQFLKYGEGGYTPYTAEHIYSTTTAQLKANGLQISDLDQFKIDRTTIATDLEQLNSILSSGQTLTWKDTGLNEIVNHLVNVGTCTIDGTPINSISTGDALQYITGVHEAKITNGILYRFEERTGGYIDVKNLAISAKVKGINGTVKANIQTSAPRDYTLFNNDLIYSESLKGEDFVGGIPVAEDTYGLAIDLWVRTNAEGSYLTLEGNVLSESETIRATSTDATGNIVELYTVTISGEDEAGESYSYSIDVYEGTILSTDGDGNTSSVAAWFNAENHALVTEEELGEANPIPKMTEVITVIGFEGENRVWDNSNSLLSTDATTQGSGSCYVYYADTPEDQARSLRLLEAFNVAFVNDKGRLLATAVMDTSRFYAVSGRVIVPLILSTSNSINLGENEFGDTTYAITALEQNVPTRITAIVYLDGTKLSNQEVLAASDIQGQLNIQFGSSNPLNPIKNETLENATRTVSASVSKTSFDYDRATEPMTTTVTVHVNGEQPNQVTAFFLRSINASQGSREETMTFTQKENGDWEADYTFTSPGEYILRTVRLDGVDYDLTGESSSLPKVTVTGFAIDYLRCAQSASNNYVRVMTAANSSTVELSMKFVSDDAEKLPKTVVGRYLRDEDGSAVNVTFTLDPTTQIWSGNATFLTSGTYTLQFLVLDGEYTELDPAFWQTAQITLGMRVAAYSSSPKSFKYIPSEMTDNMKLLAMQVKIVDNAGNEMPGLTGAKLTYSMKGSGAKTMDTDLTWNGSYYVGELTTVGPGIWQFSSVTVSGNTLTYATEYPVFTILSPEPPEYYAKQTTTYQYSPENNATMNVQITNSAAATVQAYIIKDGEKDGHWVTGTIGSEGTTENGKPYNNWTFPVPKDANGYQDGNWQLTQLRLWNVFATDGTAYTEEAPLAFDVSSTENKTKVVSRIFVTFPEGKSADFGKDADGKITGAFLQSYTISGLYVDIEDFEGQPITGIQNVKLAYAYGNNSATYGGYTSTSLGGTAGYFDVLLANDGSGTRFVQTEDKTVQYAGSYTPTFSFSIGDSAALSYADRNLPANTPKFSVWSKTPSATITAISPSGSNAAKITYTTKSLSWGRGTEPTFTATGAQTSSFDSVANTATIYALAVADNSTQRHGKFTQPTITITIAGVDSSSAVSFTLPAGSATEIEFSRTGNGTITKTLGSATQIKSWTSNYILTHTLQAYYGHGTQTITMMTIVRDGITYTVTLDKPIVITNPSSVNQ